jgi:ketosteroid isomerase-like protein
MTQRTTDTGRAHGPTEGGSEREILERFWALAEQGDFDGMAGLVADDFETAWPQSGERFRGRDRAMAALRAQPETPTLAGEPRLLGFGTGVWVTLVPVRYGDVLHHYVGVFEVSAGRLRRATEYFAAPFEPRPERVAFAEPSD